MCTLRMLVLWGSLCVLGLCSEVQAQIAVIDVANLAQNTITALNEVRLVADEVLELTGWASLALDSAYQDDLDTLGAIVKDAQGLSYDLGSLNTQITALFQLSSAPNGMSALKQRLADIRSTMVQSYIYALRTQTLIKTTQNTIRHLKNLVSDIDIMLGNKEGHQTTAQVDSALNKTLATLQAQTSAFERAESVERLGDAVAVESLIHIHQAIMEDYPKQ